MDATIQTIFAAVVVLPVLALGQVKSDEPIKTALCEIVESPGHFNAKTVTLRGPIQIAFENFSLFASECAERKIDYVWLEYGRGPKRQPTI